MRFVLLDESGGAPTSSGETIDATKLAAIADACTIQLNREFSAEWGGNYSVRAGAGAGDIQPGEIVFAMLAQLSQAGAIAYHDSDGNGVPTLFDGVTLSDTVLGAGNSVSVAISHELLETALDEGCNDWVDDGKGNSFAKEACDAVESNSYLIGGVAVSDFLLKSFFVAGRLGPYNYMSLAGLGGSGPAGPMLTAPGGYQIMRQQGSDTKAVYSSPVKADIHARSIPFPGSRAFGRGEKRRSSISRQSKRGLRG